MDVKILLTLVTLFIGALLGFISNLFLKNKDAKHNITGKILDQYFHVRNLICKELSQLSNLNEYEQIEDTYFIEARNKISNLYFEYYDFLPKEVLEELNCLFVCLSDKKNRLFNCLNQRVVPIADSDLVNFVKRISLVENYKYYTLIQLRSKNNYIRRRIAVKCQARSVLVSINELFTMKQLINWIEKSTKN